MNLTVAARVQKNALINYANNHDIFYFYGQRATGKSYTTNMINLNYDVLTYELRLPLNIDHIQRHARRRLQTYNS